MTAVMHLLPAPAGYLDAPDDDLHPVHGEFDCDGIEKSNRRGWAKVATLTTRVETLDELLTEARRAAATATAERDANEAAVTDLTTSFIEAEERADAAESLAASRALADTVLPDAEQMAAAAWREATGRARGPVPAAWREHLTSGDAADRVAAAVAAAYADALAAEAAAFAANAS